MKAILFDLDGVLTRDPTGTYSVMNYLSDKVKDIKKFEYAYRGYNRALLYGQLTHKEVWEDILEKSDERIDLSILEEAFQATPMDSEMMDLVRLLSLTYKVGLVTDNKVDRVETILSHNSLKFDAIVVSAELACRKDEPGIFEAIINRLDVSYEDCVFIDNSQKNLIVPSSLGMKTIHFDDKKRPFGAFYSKLLAYGVKIEVKK
jgi:putative hydrolase of the HAD superfamily